MRHGDDNIVDMALSGNVDKVAQAGDEGVAAFQAKSLGGGPLVLYKVGETLVT